MYCTNCGATVPDDANFCARCGRAVEDAHAAACAELNAEPQPQSPLDETDASVVPRAQGDAVRSTTPRPWLRFWAKMVDVWLSAIVLALLFSVLFPQWTMETNETLFGLILLACTVPIHALLISVFGTTAGKALFNIQVTHKGQKLYFGQAFRREAMVYVRGFGLGIPIISLITHIVAFNDLTENGSSSWDRDSGNIVTHGSPSVGGVVGAIAILFVALFMIFYGTTATQGY